VEAATDESPLKLSPFALEKAIQGSLGTVTQVKKLRNGTLFIEVARQAQSTNIRNFTTLAGIPVRVSEHRTLNYSKGVIYSPELASMEMAELLSELKDQGVTDVKHITTTKDGVRRNSGTMILTFRSPALPDSLKAGYIRVKIKKFIPNPLRCFRCQKFGHHQQNCKRDQVCHKCGRKAHEDTNCACPPHCINCGGDHPANFNKCPTWLKEKEICKVKTLQNITYPEARAAVGTCGQSSSQTQSYASALTSKPAMISVATQTLVTQCQCTENYALMEGGKIILPRSQKTSRTTSTSEAVASADGVGVPEPPRSSKSSSPSADRGRALSKSQPPPADKRRRYSCGGNTSRPVAGGAASGGHGNAPGPSGLGSGPGRPPDPGGGLGKAVLIPIKAPK